MKVARDGSRGVEESIFRKVNKWHLLTCKGGTDLASWVTNNEG